MKKYFLITYQQSQYGFEPNTFMESMDKTPVEFILWSMKYAEENPAQQYGEPIILWSMEITKEEYDKLEEA